MQTDLSRRAALRALTISAAGSGFVVPAVGEELSAPAASTNPAGVCVLLPQAVEGPFYFDPKLDRADITEGRDGAPVTLNLRIVDAKTCLPMPGVRVDVWHADAHGVYSGYDGQGDGHNVSAKGETYLRGTQTTGSDGVVTFRTIYPGWYPGRTPHIHVKAFLDDLTLVTGQVYFPDAMSARIYAGRAPYDLRPTADTSNATDFLFQQGEREGGGIVLAVSETGGAITAALLIGVDRSGAAARRAGGFGGFLRRIIGQ